MGKHADDTHPPAIQKRISSGKSHRQSISLESHADLAIDDNRPDPVQLLQAQDERRLQPLVPIRHGRMHATPFTFYRGAAAIMASDLARGSTTDLQVQLCGDAHLSNFGVFNGPDRRLIFDVNDFDETLPGPFDWDLKRLAASVTVAGRHNELKPKQVRSATRASIRGYRETLRATIHSSPLDVHYFRIELEALLERSDEKLRKRDRKAIAKATRKDSVRALKKLTEVVDGQHRIVSKPPVVTRLDGALEGGDRAAITSLFDGYRRSLEPDVLAVLNRYRFVDIAHKVVGVGSVGSRCLIVLLEGDQGDPLFLQFKEATQSVLEPYLGQSQYEQSGERVVRGQVAMQAAGDIMLGWSRGFAQDGRKFDFYFRQLWDGKGSAEVEEMGPKRLKHYARNCGATLALAHARTGDAAAISGYLGDDKTADHIFADFAERYADLNDQDYGAHSDGIQTGRVFAILDQ